MNEAVLPPSLTEDKPPVGTAPSPAPIMDEDPGDSSIHVDRGGQERELAFQAAPFLWHDKPLIPFAIDREGDWLLHRTLVGAPPLSAVFAAGSAFTADACRILWFCSHDTKEWMDRRLPAAQALQAALEPEAPMTAERWAKILEERIRAWSVEHIHPGEQTAAVDLAFQIFNRAHTNRALIKPEPKGKDAGSGN